MSGRAYALPDFFTVCCVFAHIFTEKIVTQTHLAVLKACGIHIVCFYAGIVNNYLLDTVFR